MSRRKDVVGTTSDTMELRGRVNDACRGCYKVTLDEGGSIINATLSGKMRQHKIRVVMGDTVLVEVSLADPTRGLITRRL
jgi:translation initiation factor IF-1